MRLLITTDTVGGVWTFTQELAGGLLNAGCEVALVSIGRPPTGAQTDSMGKIQGRFGESFRFHSIDAPLEWEQSNELAFTAAAPMLLRYARDFDAELIHANQFCFGALNTLLPVIVTAHSDVLSWAAACRAEPLERTPWLQRYHAFVMDGLTQAGAVSAPTQWMLDALVQNLGPTHEAVSPDVAFAPWSCIPNGRTLPKASARYRKLQAISAGRLWDEAKNIALLAQVNAPMPILVAGETSHEAAVAPQVLGSAKLLGPLAEAELLAQFRQSALYLCTSRYEPFGLAALEAALCGCAVLCNDIPSMREVWSDSALYFHDADSLSILLHQLAADPDSVVRAQARSAARAALYTGDAMTAAYLELYRYTAEQHTRTRERCRAA